MAFFDNIFRREGSTTEQSTQTTSTVTGVDTIYRILGSSNEEVAMKLATVYHCMGLISQGIAQMPIRFMRLKNGVFADYIKNDPNRLYYLLNVKPNEWMSAYQLKQQMIMDYLGKGNAYILPVDVRGIAVDAKSGTIDHLVLLDPDRVIRINTCRRKYLVSDPNQLVPEQDVLASRIIHIRNLNGNSHGHEGQSTLHYALTSIQQGMTTHEEIKSRMANGGVGKFLFRYKDTATKMGTYNARQMETKADDIAQSLSTKLVTAVSTENAEVIPLAMNSADLRLIETTHLSKSDIALTFHVPLYYVGENTSNYKTPGEARVMLVNDCFAPICAQIESEFMAWYTDETDYWKYKFDFDEDSRIALDSSAKAALYKSLLESGLRTVNELRASDYMDPVEGGDKLLVSANLKAATEMSETNNNAE